MMDNMTVEKITMFNTLGIYHLAIANSLNYFKNAFLIKQIFENLCRAHLVLSSTIFYLMLLLYSGNKKRKDNIPAERT